ncbi:hypothetical protein, precursor [Deinococcus deserti VCD115]|uniref:Lipoprotein n=2 Tax=Deinococcus TaxID=1298 RepID=X5GY40_DEIDV|nr:hypothetical protein, precursor [Deinococcus deserti VCD115]
MELQMKQALALFAVALLSIASAACPTKPGYAANGLVKLPPGVNVTCEGAVYREYRSMVSGESWGEVLYVPRTSKGAASLTRVVKMITAKGYKEISRKKTDQMLIIRFRKNDAVLTSMRSEDREAMYMVLTGK